jgi:NAD(P)H-dependent FMN reductase
LHRSICAKRIGRYLSGDGIEQSMKGPCVRLQIIIGSIREGRISLPIAKWVRDEATEQGEFAVELVDLEDWQLPMFALAKPPAMGSYQDALQIRWAENVAKADAFLFVCPEYNHGYPPVLKNALDYVFAEWHRKPATFVAFGNAGGARAVEQLRLVLIELQVAPLSGAVHLRDAHSKLRDGKYQPAPEDNRRLRAALDDLSWWAKALRVAKDSLPTGN